MSEKKFKKFIPILIVLSTDWSYGHCYYSYSIIKSWPVFCGKFYAINRNIDKAVGEPVATCVSAAAVGNMLECVKYIAFLW